MKSVFDSIAKISESIELTINYADRSEKVSGKISAILDGGIFLDQMGTKRFVNYSVISDFSVPASENYFHSSAGLTVIPDEVLPASIVDDSPRPPQLPPEPTSSRNYKFDLGDLSQTVLGRKLMSIRDKVNYAIKIDERHRITQGEFTSLIDDCVLYEREEYFSSLLYLTNILRNNVIERLVLESEYTPKSEMLLSSLARLEVEEGNYGKAWGICLFTLSEFVVVDPQTAFLRLSHCVQRADKPHRFFKIPETKSFRENARIAGESYETFLKVMSSEGYPAETDEYKFEDLPFSGARAPLLSVDEMRHMTGRVIEFRQADYAAIIEAEDRSRFYFSLASANSEKLKNSLNSGFLSQEVSFTSGRQFYGNSNLRFALSVRATNEDQLPGATRSTGPSSVSPGNKTPSAAPDAPIYRAAKADELRGNVAGAEKKFRLSIQTEPSTVKSAIKDLAQLLSRLERTEESLDLLRDNKAKFASADRLSVLNMTAHFQAKIGWYGEAAQTYKDISRSHTDSKRKTAILKQAAYALYYDGKFDEALAELTAIKSWIARDDNQYLELVSQVKEAIRTGVVAKSDTALVALSKELQVTEIGPIGRKAIENCRFEMVDQRSRERGYFGEDDIKALNSTFNRRGGERPALRAQIALHLAAIYHSSDSLFDAEEASKHLVRFLTLSAEAAFVAGDIDIVLSYLQEAFSVAAVRKERNDDAKIYRMILAAVQKPKIDTLKFLEVAGKEIFQPKAMLNSMIETTRGDICEILSLMATGSRNAFEIFSQDIESKKYKSNFDALVSKRREEGERIESALSRIMFLSSELSPESLQKIEENISQLPLFTLDIDRVRLKSLIELISESSRYFSSDDYIEKEQVLTFISASADRHIAEYEGKPTRYSVSYLVNIISNIKERLESDFERYQDGLATEFKFRDMLSDSYYVVDESYEVEIRTEISVAKSGAPITGLQLALKHSPKFIEMTSKLPQTVRGGESREGTIGIKVDRSAVDEGVLDLYGSLLYNARGNSDRVSADFSLTINLQPNEGFKEISNPYARFRGGSPVDDPEMFFGREEIVRRIIYSISQRPNGQCFVLYGQKRSGKTSILYHLRKALQSPFLPVYISLGAVSDEANIQVELYTQILGEIAYAAQKAGYSINHQDYSSSDGVSYPSRMRDLIDAIRAASSDAKGGPRNIVLLIDEFTMIFDAIKEGTVKPTFMRNWKNIIESGLVSAVIVGQDSMPRFFDEYSNEFGVSDKARLSYLSQDASDRLCNEPILFDGATRYKGNSLSRVYQITNGSAFFQQKFCYELVEYLNYRRRPFVTRVDVDYIFRQLVEGDKALQEADFDPLFQETGFKTSLFQKKENMRVLQHIAANSHENRGALLSGSALPEEWKGVLEDLQRRDVIVSDAHARYRISIELFAEWLRINRPI